MRDEARKISGSLRMREPRELAGRWLIDVGQQHCSIILTAERVEGANGWRLDGPMGCLTALIPGAAAWRPSPEGLEIAAADRRTLLVVTATGEAAVGTATLPDGRALTLRPA